MRSTNEVTDDNPVVSAAGQGGLTLLQTLDRLGVRKPAVVI